MRSACFLSATRRVITLAAALALLCVCARAQKLVVVSWNLESGESSDRTIADRVKTFQGVDLWGLSEVAGDETARTFEEAAEDGENADFRRVLGTTGGGDRLAVVYNATRFRLVAQEEIDHINQGNHRAPLVARLSEAATGREFLFMVNHLARGNSALRHRQGTLLNEWARRQTLPVIAVGDYNFDWEVAGGDRRHDRGYDNMTAGGAWAWVRPSRLVKTQCDASYNSVLDFVFVNQAASGWPATSVIIEEQGDCDDDEFKPDHRPVKAEFELGGAAPGPPPTKAEILQRVEDLERQLRQLKEAVRRLP
jgi:endonuclease/exonuclease/phosphatase family metal-dependent hydrolase